MLLNFFENCVMIFDGSGQDCRISNALAMGMLQFRAKP